MESKGKAEDFFSKMGKKIDELVQEIKASDISEKIHLKERLEELKRDKEKLTKEFEIFTQENKGTFDDIRNSMEESIEDIKKSFRKAKKDN